MKRFHAPALVLLCTLLLGGVAFPQANVVVKEFVTVLVNRAVVRTDVPPINVSGQTLVPVRGIFNAFGAEIDWFSIEKRVLIRQNSKVIQLKIGDASATVNNAVLPLAVPAMIYRGRTMVPLRFIAESLGATVTWDASTQTITIITPEQPSSSD